MKRHLAVLAIIVALAGFAPPEACCQDQVQAVTGGATISVTGSYDKVFQGIVAYLKRSGYLVGEADKDTGLVASTMEISGSRGKRLVFSVLNDKSDHTLVRVAVSLQKRHKDSWAEPTVDEDASTDLANKVQNDLLTQLGHN